jgi:hypothetical protein
MAEDVEIVPSAKILLLGAAGLIIMIAVGGALGFSDVASVFKDRLTDYTAWESGYSSPVAGLDGKVMLDIGIDMRSNFNSTHGIVYWYLNITVDLNSTMMNVMGNLSKAKVVELRVYNLQNASQWSTIRDANVSNYLWDIEYVDFSGYSYISSIGGVSEDPGAMTQWLTYRWSEKTGNFDYVVQSTTKFQPSNGDQIVLLYSQLGVYPTDCCSGGSAQYVEYQGPS